MTSRPSYDLKIDRAEKHLIDLEKAAAAYSDSKPYEVRVRSESKKQPNVHRFHFTHDPSDELAVIAGDFIYNLRSALDHLMAALVPADRRTKVYFPVYFAGVWNPPVAGENPERTKERGRWESDTRKAHPDAIAILQDVQPDDSTRNDPQRMNGLTALNKLAVKDRHTKLPVIASTLRYPSGTCRGPDGSIHRVRSMAENEGIRDGTKLVVPNGAMDVQIEGSVAVLVRIGSNEGGVLIDAFRATLLKGTQQVIDLLRPYDRSRRS